MPKSVIFRDDFEEPSLNLDLWRPNWVGGSDTQITPPINGHEVNCYDPAQVSVEDGNLVLRAKSGTFVDSHGSKYSYASGCVTTQPHVTFTPPVHVQARIWIQGGASIDNWPQFWCDGAHWPQNGEIDIVEGLGGHAAYHFHSGPHPEGVGGGGALADRPHAHAGSWHHFGCLWTPDRLDFEYDHKPVGTIASDVTHDPMFLILSYGLSPSISPPVKVPAEMRVDFVEVAHA